MAQVVTIKQGARTLWMLRGKVGDRVYQVRNGKQVITKMPRRRSTPPGEHEKETRSRFKAVMEVYMAMSAEERARYAAEWRRDEYKYNGKKYCTLRGYIFGRIYKEWM